MIRKACLQSVVLCVLLLPQAAGSIPDSLFFRQAEDSLVVLARDIMRPADDAGRLKANSVFIQYFGEVLSQPGSMDHAFDSLRTVSLISPSDGRFRLITWYVPLQRQRFRYFGFLQGENRQGVPVELHDETHRIDWEDEKGLLPERWYGAFYYDIIEHPGHEFYTLLGWKGHSPILRKRVVEILDFTGGEAVFGRPLFAPPYENHWRIVFQYSARVSMSLLKESIGGETPGDEQAMIVFDRLHPMNEGLQGRFQFYVPEANVFDAFFFEDGSWLYVPDVDLRMPERP